MTGVTAQEFPTQNPAQGIASSWLWGLGVLIQPLVSQQLPRGTSPGPTWQKLDTGRQLTVSSHLLLPFTPWAWREGRAEVSCPLLAFRLPLLPRKGPSQVHYCARTCVVPRNARFAVPPPPPCLLGLTSPAASFHWGTCYREATAQLKAGDRLHMAPNDMLHIASCAPHMLPRTHGRFLVPNPHHRLTALLAWGCRKCCGSWGQGVCRRLDSRHSQRSGAAKDRFKIEGPGF